MTPENIIRKQYDDNDCEELINDIHHKTRVSENQINIRDETCRNLESTIGIFVFGEGLRKFNIFITSNLT